MQSVAIKPQVNIMAPPAVMAAKASSAGASGRVMSTPAGLIVNVLLIKTKGTSAVSADFTNAFELE